MRINFLLAATMLSTIGFGQSYMNIEATEYDEANNRFFVSNGTSIIARASNGTLTYFGDAEADYGMEIIGNTLFAINSTGSYSIEGYDLNTAEEVMVLNLPGTDFLNGMATDGVSKLWVTDFGGGSIIEVDVSDLSDPQYSIVVPNTSSIPNGIVYDGDNNRLVFVNWGMNAPIKAIDLSDYSMSTIINSGLTNIDGIDNDAQGNFYISSWSPTRITKYNNDFSVSEIIDAPGLSSPADISYAQAIDTLAVPNSGNETLTLIGFTAVGIDWPEESSTALSIFPNPVTDSSVISFKIEQASFVRLNIFSQDGKLVHSLLKENRESGTHSVLLTGLALETGAYVCKLEIGDSAIQQLFVKN